MDIEKDILPDNIDELKSIILSLSAAHNTRYNSLLKNYTILNNKYKAAMGRFFSPTKERISAENEGQLGLFNETEAFVDESPDDPAEDSDKTETVTIKEYTRKKGGKRKLPDTIPADEIVYELDESEKGCNCCGKNRPIVGEDRSEELSIIPMQIKKIVHVAKKYGPCSCDEFLNSGEKEILTAPKPLRIIPYSIVSPELLAYVIYMKYEMALPFYRLSKKFDALDIEISRATLCNWSMLAAEKCETVYQAMLEYIKKHEVIQMDETHVQVLNEEGRAAETKSFMWVMKNGGKRNLTLFHYSPTRNSTVPLDLLKGFKGFLQTDGYEGYSKAVREYELEHVSCLAHMRRKFFEAHKANTKSKTANTGLKYINKIYEIERKLRSKKFMPDEFVTRRKEQIIPVLDEFKKWLDDTNDKILPSSGSGKAISYALGQWNKFINFHEHADLTPDNNAVENAIRPFVIGRKNWMFSNTPRGAKSSAVLYSLVESAKNNKLNVYNYLRFLFVKLPYAKTSEDIQNLLPCNLSSEDIKI